MFKDSDIVNQHTLDRASALVVVLRLYDMELLCGTKHRCFSSRSVTCLCILRKHLTYYYRRQSTIVKSIRHHVPQILCVGSSLSEECGPAYQRCIVTLPCGLCVCLPSVQSREVITFDRPPVIYYPEFRFSAELLTPPAFCGSSSQ